MYNLYVSINVNILRDCRLYCYTLKVKIVAERTFEHVNRCQCVHKL